MATKWIEVGAKLVEVVPNHEFDISRHVEMATKLIEVGKFRSSVIHFTPTIIHFAPRKQDFQKRAKCKCSIKKHLINPS